MVISFDVLFINLIWKHCPVQIWAWATVHSGLFYCMLPYLTLWWLMLAISINVQHHTCPPMSSLQPRFSCLVTCFDFGRQKPADEATAQKQKDPTFTNSVFSSLVSSGPTMWFYDPWIHGSNHVAVAAATADDHNIDDDAVDDNGNHPDSPKESRTKKF